MCHCTARCNSTLSTTPTTLSTVSQTTLQSITTAVQKVWRVWRDRISLHSPSTSRLWRSCSFCSPSIEQRLFPVCKLLVLSGTSAACVCRRVGIAEGWRLLPCRARRPTCRAGRVQVKSSKLYLKSVCLQHGNISSGELLRPSMEVDTAVQSVVPALHVVVSTDGLVVDGPSGDGKGRAADPGLVDAVHHVI
jgi:hypothetical protein